MLYPPVIALITLHTSIDFQHTQEVQASRSRSRHIAESKVQRTVSQSGLVLPSRRRFVFTNDVILAHMDLLTVCVRKKT